MTDNMVSAEALMKHICALSDGIGPRPAGTPREAQAQAYVRKALGEMGIRKVETLHFKTSMTWTPALMVPTALAFAGNFLLGGRRGRLVGGLLSLFAAYSLWQTLSGRRSIPARIAQTKPSTTQFVRIAPKSKHHHTLVLIGHVDSNKDRATFSPQAKHLLVMAGTTLTLATVMNGVVQLIRAVGSKRALGLEYALSLGGLLTGLVVNSYDDMKGYIDGANDNASAVACLLGLAGHFKANPLEHTEVWLAFTGAEEVGLLGLHTLLDIHGNELKDAYFLDFEMVGAGELAYVTHHSSLSSWSGYTPDPYSAALAAETARQHPDLGIKGKSMVILEEISALRARGYKGLCLVGVGEDGFLVNWHQKSDVSANIDPAKLEKAARFALAYAETLDQK